MPDEGMAARGATRGFDDDAARWAAVTGNDASADGHFYYAVITTGVYCRPSCRSRMPKRENVQFYDNAAAAEAAGYRPCRKCLGQDAAEIRRREAVTRACALLDGAEETAPTLDALAAETGLSPYHLQRTFKAVTGVTPRQYWDARRLARLRQNLKSGEAVAPALYGAGYGSSSRLYEKARGQLGMTPATYGKGGKGAVIAFTTAASPLGPLLVAATEAGICFVSLGNEVSALETGLREEFPRAEIVREDETLGELTDRVLASLDGGTPDSALPLDIQATAFQRQVWEALMAIPAGETRTYGELAEAIGKPGAARAVGRACGSNRVALVIPCHRAVGANGSLTGYRWGTERKRRLLDAERAGNAKRLAAAG
ncbi:bifunctional DNA-binding transcriptional regulator/O6-methylguanine-DNA methyltransferase Ada [Nisaea acidiphila]|uniref:methylated-DNA--[protein]-cysteine S-methyltransferase n=1 Tax=Nisaea acidiphila TaxID=1862145 RepID=A0A9J7B355_9PROT|nr:bifunctional DNA-binding transcriptional regulator/O6-methylguanine-DNA methyltransferase Ada [Nisaea acidiphila]UUX52077.1 bifunctional DNA-binding transcriptional regulator/O6-methylguanine-DNA methyltransferase Ada [Nisaea acidiphila]